MEFLHNSSLKSHGNLKPTTCLVDSRMQVKISGFGLWEFRYGTKHKVFDLESPKYEGQFLSRMTPCFFLSTCSFCFIGAFNLWENVIMYSNVSIIEWLKYIYIFLLKQFMNRWWSEMDSLNVFVSVQEGAWLSLCDSDQGSQPNQLTTL